MLIFNYNPYEHLKFGIKRQAGYVRFSNFKFEPVHHLALNLARALARNNILSKSMIRSKSKKKASRKDNTLLI